MPWKYTDEFYREYTRTTWNDSAKAYVDLMGRLAPFRTEAIGLLAPQAGEMILDVGTGPGEPAISIARRVVPGGRVVGVDLSERMVALAVDAARSQEVANLSFDVMDSSRLDFPPSTFDAAVSCFGFQIFTDPDASARELVRVLKPHGRAVVSVWAPRASVPFLDVMVAPMREQAEPDEPG